MKKLIIGIVAAMVAFLLFGCTGTGPADGDGSELSSDHPAYQAYLDGAIGELQFIDWKHVTFPSGSDVVWLQSDLQDSVTRAFWFEDSTGGQGMADVKITVYDKEGNIIADAVSSSPTDLLTINRETTYIKAEREGSSIGSATDTEFFLAYGRGISGDADMPHVADDLASGGEVCDIPYDIYVYKTSRIYATTNQNFSFADATSGWSWLETNISTYNLTGDIAVTVMGDEDTMLTDGVGLTDVDSYTNKLASGPTGDYAYFIVEVRYDTSGTFVLYYD